MINSSNSTRRAMPLMILGAALLLAATPLNPAHAQNGGENGAPVMAPARDLMPSVDTNPVDVQYGDPQNTQGVTPDIAGKLLTTGPTHPQISLTPDKTEIMRLDRDPGTIIVGNPNHLTIVMESKRSLLLVPRQPGSTFVRILDTKGDVMMQRHVAVVAPAKNYVRIRRSCGAGSRDCESTSVYYCPDTCHPVDLVQTNPNAGAGIALPSVETPDINGAAVVETPDNPNAEEGMNVPTQDMDDDTDASTDDSTDESDDE